MIRALVAVVLAASAVILLPAAPVSSVPTGTTPLSGEVRSGEVGLEGFEVVLYATQPGATAPIPLGESETEADGSFDLSSTTPAADGIAYLVARSGDTTPVADVVTLVSVLGPTPLPASVVINERTTVAASYAMAQFTGDGVIAGPSPGLPNAAGMVRNLVDPVTGRIGAVLDTEPNGDETSTRRAFNSLANMIAACSTSPAACVTFLDAATPPGGPPPADTWEAMVGIVHDPGHDPDALFAVATLSPAPYQPALDLPPAAWTLALRFNGDGASMSGPGNVAIDHEGNLWVANNYVYSADRFESVCGSNLVLKFTPTGQYVPGSPYTGGGVNGVGLGIDIDPYGDIWLGNFGFAAPDCDEQPPHNSVSQFHPDGSPVSPSATATSTGGYTEGGISWPQGTVSDDHGNIWIANCQNHSVTLYPGGDPSEAKHLTDLGVTKPFDIAHNLEGRAFITGTESDNVAMVRPDGSPLPGSPITGGGIAKPMGIAADSQGNQWVANSGLVDLPCPDTKLAGSDGGSVTLLQPDGTPVRDAAFTGGGVTIPWGIAVDGDDNVWVANFAEKRLSQFCGTRPATCPDGKTTGDPISPDGTGYFFDGLVRNTGVGIDPSGNVWLMNNWKEIPIQANPGGYEIVAFLGLAEPVVRPAPIPRPAPTPVPEAIPLSPTFTG